MKYAAAETEVQDVSMSQPLDPVSSLIIPDDQSKDIEAKQPVDIA